MTDGSSPCGCPWDGIACPHCGRGEDDDHIRRHHQTATGYPVPGLKPELRYQTFKKSRINRV